MPCNTTVLSFVYLLSSSSPLDRLSLCILTKLHKCFSHWLEVLNLLIECWLWYCLSFHAIMALHRAIRPLSSLCISHHPKLQPSIVLFATSEGPGLSEEQMTIPQWLLLLALRSIVSLCVCRPDCTSTISISAKCNEKRRGSLATAFSFFLTLSET
jgi:hypothetical protein